MHWRVLLSLAALTLFPGLGGLGAAPPAPAAWTLAIYLQADNSLDENALVDLQEMTRAGALPNLRVVYQLDRNDEERGAGPGVERGIIQNGKRVRLAGLPELNSDQPQQVTAFMDWAFQTYPSTRRGLILWDHGGQWDGGFGGDEHGPGADEAGLTPKELAGAIRSGLGHLKVPQLDLLAFDACLMGGAELLAEFAPLTRLYLADPELDYGDGWDYAATLRYLNASPAATLRALGQAEVKLWEQHHRDGQDDRWYGVHAAYDAAAWPAVQTQLTAFTRQLQREWKADPANVWRARGAVTQYSYSSQDDPPGITRPYVDLGQFATLLAKDSRSAATKQAALALNAAIGKLIVAKSVGSKRQGVSALSVYYPTHQETVPDAALLRRYGRLNLNTASPWGEFQATWTKAVKADRTPPGLNKVSAERQGGTYHFEFTATGADVYAGMVSLYGLEGDGLYSDFGDVYYTRLSAGDYEFDWDAATWIMTDGARSSYVTADHDHPDDEFSSASALYTPPRGKAFDVLVQFTDDGKVIGVLDDSSDTPTAIEVSPGGKLQFYLRYYDANADDYSWEVQPDALRLGKKGLEGLSAELGDLPSGQYELDFTVFDYAGNECTVIRELKLK